MWFGASVSARSVKLIHENTADGERDNWWYELRKELENNALFLDCNHVLGYREQLHVFENLVILTVFGTAVKIRSRAAMLERDLKLAVDANPSLATIKLQRHHSDAVKALTGNKRSYLNLLSRLKDRPIQQQKPCSFLHLIYTKKNGVKTYSQTTKFKCLECNDEYVPELIVSTLDPPESVNIIGPPQLIEERITRPWQKSLSSEKRAIKASEIIFFIEYHLHSQVVNKVKFIGKNAVFSLRIAIYVTDESIVGVASGTAVAVTCLPLPAPISIKIDKYLNKKELQGSHDDYFREVERKSWTKLR